MAKLNDTEIGKLRWDASKRTRTGKVPGYQSVNDPEVGGLHLRIFPPKATTGQSAKVFYLGYGPSTGRKFYRIGQFGDGSWSLEAARREARKLRRNFYDHGVDPNKSKQKRIRDAKDRLTVGELVEAYQAAKEGVWASSYTASNKLHGTRLNDAVGSLFADELTSRAVLGIFDGIKKGSSSQADLFRKFGRGCYNWALDLGPLEKFAGMPNPFVSSKFNIKAVKRARVLRFKLGECGQLFDLLADFDNSSRSDGKPYLTISKLLLLTAFRSTELRDARWEHIDHKHKTFRNVKPKYGEKNAYTMPLTDMGYRLLQSLGAGHIRFRKGPIFPGQTKGDDGVSEPISGFKHWTRTLRHDPRMPLDEDGKHVTIHDLRRTSITWLQQMDFTLEKREIFKGAKLSGVTATTYSVADQEDIRMICAQAIEDRIVDVEAGEETSMFDAWRPVQTVAGSA
jgi:integrase